jgi:hypothetical protein
MLPSQDTPSTPHFRVPDVTAGGDECHVLERKSACIEDMRYNTKQQSDKRLPFCGDFPERKAGFY